jgi:cytochrome c-type biogenesis protein CcmE
VSSIEVENDHLACRPPSRSRLKLLVAIVILTLAIGYLVFSSVQSSSAYYMTIGELSAGGPSLENKKVRVAGTLLGDTVEWDARQIRLDFTITDGSGQLPVSYNGVRPDMFRDGSEAVVEGKYANGTFLATNLLLKCPSKYEESASSDAKASALGDGPTE